MIKLIRKAINPLKAFISDSRFVGVLLLFCTLVSLIFSNTGNGESYRNFWISEIHYNSFPVALPHSGLQWINDFLMAIFFLFAGMEIKRELFIGELSSFKRAILPFGAAVGGIVAPALIYSFFNITTDFSKGWGVPTATDIAFSLGIASLFGRRVPVGLRIFLMALAIIDDLGAIIIITLFYGNKIRLVFVLAATIILSTILIINYSKLKQGIVQLILSVVFWYLIFNSGIEPAISGVIIAFTIPVNSLPLFENAISRIVNFIILPVFALANTAILIPADVINSLQNSISIGIMTGLVIGKPVGIFIFSRVMISLKIAKLPSNTTLMQLFGIGSLAGIGFTMSIFISTLAFNQNVYKNVAKISILGSLVISVILSWICFFVIGKKLA
jgi:NhaA family Na+:H+ antiporter